MALPKIHPVWLFIALVTLGPLAACGSSTSAPAPLDAAGASDNHGCAPGTLYCSVCDGGAVCSAACPDFACPMASDAGGAEAAADADNADDTGVVRSANHDGGTACPSDKSSSCVDCSGGQYCVTGACPVVTCPARDAGMGVMPPGDGATPSDSTTGLDGGAGPLCPGESPPAPGYPLCRSYSDCKVGFCAEQPVFGCGATRAVDHQCIKDGDCSDAGALICQAYVETGGCVSGDPNGTRCMQKCQATTCPLDTQCSASGHCQPTPCGQGYTCFAGFACKPGDPTADPHGCIVQPCAAGFACAAAQECNPTGTMPDGHGCVPKPCSNGFACPMWSRCAAGPSADAHGCTPTPCSATAPCGTNESCDPTQPGRGCVVRKCVSDHDCDCGACVQGSCSPRLWVCVSLPA